METKWDWLQTDINKNTWKQAELANILDQTEKKTKRKSKNKWIKHRKRWKEFIQWYKSNKTEKLLYSLSIDKVQEILKQVWVEMKYKNTQYWQELIWLCPFHKEKTPSFTFAWSKWFFHCFWCGAHGHDIFAVLQRAINVSRFKAIKIVEYFISNVNQKLSLEEYLECHWIATIKISEARKNIKIADNYEEDMIEYNPSDRNLRNRDNFDDEIPF